MPATPLMDPLSLHIWPRGSHFLMALPNKLMLTRVCTPVTHTRNTRTHTHTHAPFFSFSTTLMSFWFLYNHSFYTETIASPSRSTCTSAVQPHSLN